VGSRDVLMLETTAVAVADPVLRPATAARGQRKAVCRTAARCGLRLARVGREDSLILAPRERHRQGTGVALC
jgi:hypothetical protein